MADLSIFGTILIFVGCAFDTGHGITSPPAQTNICLSEIVRGYIWNDTVQGITVSQTCQSPYNRGQIFRTCKDGRWSEPEYSTCRTVVIADRDTIYLIQYVCCGTTILCVLLTLFILVFAWRNPGADTTIVEISFGLAIIASNVAFLAGVNNTADALMCKITAVCLHYLPTVTVFHLFAIIFHLSTLRFQTSYNSYCCLLFTVWGVPALIIGLYGYFTRLEEYGNSENCWMLFSTRLFWVYYGTLMAVCGLTFLSLFGIIYRMKLPGRGPKLGSGIGAVPVCIVFITTIMTWVTGVISVNEYNDGLYITQIIFGTFNFIQGLVYLIVFGVMGSRARKEKAFRKSETRLSRMSLPTVSTYTGYRDDHVRDWSYSRYLHQTQRQPVTDFYSTDEEVQERYMEERRRDEGISQMSTREDSQGNLSSFQVNNTPERQGNAVVVVQKEVVFAPDRILSVDQMGADANITPKQSNNLHTIQQRMVNVNDPYQNTSTDDEGITFSTTKVERIFHEQRQSDPVNRTNSPTPNEFRQTYDDDITAEPLKIVVEGSQAVSQPPSEDRMESKDNETRINAAAFKDDGIDGGTQPSSPVTQRTRNSIDPPAPSRISVTEIETFTIDVSEEKVTKNESNEFILQDEGEVVMEYRNDHYPSNEDVDHQEASHENSEGTSGVPFRTPLERATASLDNTESHKGSMVVYHEEEGNTLQHITNGIATGNGFDQAEDDSEYMDASSSTQPAPLTTGTEEPPADISSFRNKLKTRKYTDYEKPKSKLDLSSSFLSRLRRKLRPVSKKPNRDSPPELVEHQEPGPDYESIPLNYDQKPEFAIRNQSEDLPVEGSHRRQMEIPDEDLLPPPTYSPETHEPEELIPPPLAPRPPTPPPPFVPSNNPPTSLVPPPPPPPPPPSIPQSSLYGKHVSFSNRDIEISSHL